MAELGVHDIAELVGGLRMLICRLCSSAVRPGEGIERHFRTHKVKGQLLADIKAYYADVALDDPVTAELPPDGSPPISALHSLTGYSCGSCRFLTVAYDSLVRHWRTATAAGHEAETPRWDRVRLQSWSWQLRQHMRYWIVSDGQQRGEGAREGEESAAKGSVLEDMIRQFESRMADEDAARLRRGNAAEEGAGGDSPWVKRTGWARHFGVRDLLDIFQAASWVHGRSTQARRTGGVEDDEKEARERLQLIRLGHSFDREIERCCWRLDRVPTETLQWLASVSPTLPYGTPFGRKDRASSMQKYRSIGQRYLGFCVRAYWLGREEAHEAWAVSFSDEQWGLLGDIVYELGDDGIRSTNDSGYLSGDDDMCSGRDDDDDDDSPPAGDGRAQETTALDRAVFTFLVKSIKQQVGGNVYASPLLSFCAALGVTQRPLGFTEAHLYTGMLAGLMWCIRLIILEAVFEGHDDGELEDVGLEQVLLFKEEHAKWMCIGTHTVVSTIIMWMAYGKGYRKRLGGQPSVRWEEGNQALFHSGERIAIEDFKRTFGNLVGEAEGVLDQLMSGTWASVNKELHMGRITDSLLRLGAGQSFATNPKNDWLEPGPGKVIRLAGSKLWNATRNCWKRTAVKKWLRMLRQLREPLMALSLAWGGMPGRGLEVTALLHCDSLEEIRSMFVVDGQVMFVTDRDKMKAVRDGGRKVARFLPDRISRMLVAYVLWLLPAERMLCRAGGFPEPRAEALGFLWRDGQSRVWDTERLSRVLGRITQAGVGVYIGLARYRPVAIEMGRKIRGLVMQQLETQVGDDDEDEGSAEIDPATGEVVDCGGTWNIIWDLQSTHGTRIARQHYAVNIGFPGRLQPEMVASYREISRLWHQFLDHDAVETEPGATPGKRKGAPTQHTATAAGAKRARVPAGAKDTAQQGLEEEMAAGLRKLLGPQATWRSDKQAESMRAIMALKDHEAAISVLPTGAGKSILFMLPAVMRDAGTSIVVVPYVALIEDLVSRGRAMGIDCIRFRTTLSAGRENMARAARLVVVSADVIASAEFSAYADGLLATGLLQRIFVDECHTVIMDVSYRARLAELSSLHRYACPLVLLTATLPVVLEDWFRSEMLVQSAIIIRDRTTKFNCKYRVEQVEAERSAVEKRTIEIMETLSTQMTGVQKGVVYCRSKAQCEAIAAKTSAGFHHSGMSDELRRDARERWATGTGYRWIAATTGLGTGIDIEGITAVVHMDQPFGLVDFVQQTGRGARREGEVVESIVVYGGRPAREDRHRSFVDDNNQMQMQAFLTTPGCRRAVIGAFMDGVAGETCKSIGGATELCDGCIDAVEELDGEQAEQGGGTWTAFNKREGLRMQKLQAWLEEATDKCAGCSAAQLEARHGAADACGRRYSGKTYKEIREMVRFGPLSCCFRCKLPLDWCERTKVTDGEGTAKCGHVDKVLPVVLQVYHCARLNRLARRMCGFSPREGLGEFLQWLGQDRRFHGMKGTNALALWEEIVNRIYIK